MNLSVSKQVPNWIEKKKQRWKCPHWCVCMKQLNHPHGMCCQYPMDFCCCCFDSVLVCWFVGNGEWFDPWTKRQISKQTQFILRHVFLLKIVHNIVFGVVLCRNRNSRVKESKTIRERAMQLKNGTVGTERSGPLVGMQFDSLGLPHYPRCLVAGQSVYCSPVLTYFPCFLVCEMA